MRLFPSKKARVINDIKTAKPCYLKENRNKPNGKKTKRKNGKR